MALFIAYVVIGAGLSYIRGGSFLTPDRIAVLLLAGAIMLGRGKAFVRDWGPFLLLLFGYELMRGVADNMTNLGAYSANDHGRILVQSLIDGDKALFSGTSRRSGCKIGSTRRALRTGTTPAQR